MMVARTMSLVGTQDFGFLKETLHAQQELLQKLYNELDMERESSATAADETLSMILRLQGEKAAMEMEASQYKRIAEEKMCHAHETHETFQEVIYQKEMQIASLEFQVKAYKFKLASLGFNDLASSDLQYPENMLSKKNELVGEISSQSSIKTFARGYSLPPRVDSNSYREEIKKLDEKVKGFTCLNNLNCFPIPEGSLNQSESASPMHDPSPDSSLDKLDLYENSEKVVDVQKCGESQCSTSVQDIDEVPQCSDDHKKGKPESCLEKETRNIKIDRERSSPKSDPKEIIDLERKPKDGKCEKQKLFKHPTFGVADCENKQFNRRFKQLEGESCLSRVRESSYESGDEELKLLWEIMEKVEAVQSEITSWRTKKPPPPEDRSFGCFKEVLLCFLP